MSGSITFQHGPFQGWHLQLDVAWHDGQPVRALVQLETPHRPGRQRLSGLLTLAPGIEGWDEARAAEFPGGPVRMAELLQWVIEAHRSALDRLTTIPDGPRQHWQAIVDLADETRADFYARYADGIVPPFEVVARLTFDPAADLVGAR